MSAAARPPVPESAACELCQTPGGTLVWEDTKCRVIRVEDPAYPGFCRVIWREHVAEMSDLPPAEREHVMRVVLATEITLRRLMQPAKINLASLGNVVPHLHWHVIPRFADDRQFPQPIWGTAQREGAARSAPSIEALRAGIVEQLG
jgi:diadenosine tetraphosphate (Ap4A) HIT family hydrolase